MQTTAKTKAQDRAAEAKVFSIPSPRAKAFVYYSGLRHDLKMDAKISEWAQANPAVHQWIMDKREVNNFARSLYESLNKWGRLTDNQTAAVLRILK